MIFVHDRGQMCNNILQYGHIYAWCREHGRNVMSMRFAYKYQYFHICQTRHHNFGTYVAAKYAAKLKLIPTVDFDLEPQQDETGMSKMMLQHKTMLVDGWSVHFHDLFRKYLGDIRKLFAFLPEVEQEAQLGMMPWLTREGCVCLGVHIRRGDYARFLGGRYFYDDATMLRLIREFSQMFTGKTVVAFVCGNDPHLDSEMYQEAVPEVHFVFPKGNPGEDLCLLSHCDYLIGAPSTFSLVASMYRDLPLYWIREPEAPLSDCSFSRFDTLFRKIDEVFGPVNPNNETL